MKVFIFLLLFFLFQSAHSESKVALIIGNSSYSSSRLQNPMNDANALDKKLKKLGFHTIKVLNGNQQRMERSVKEFERKLRLNKNTVGLFYFSGHGIQHGGINYLIPIGTIKSVSSAEQLKYKTVSLGYVLEAMGAANNKFNMAIIDACRTSPFKAFSRSVKQGLGVEQDATGMIVAYATAPNKVALDGAGRNSPYVASILSHIEEPNLKVEELFKKVLIDVKKKTKGKQVPWYNSSASGYFSFKKGISPASSLHLSGNNNQNCILNDNLHKAAARGNLNFVSKCLKSGVSANVLERNGWTPLHSAARSGRVKIISLLIRYKANINAVDKTGRTPLDQAIFNNSSNAINLLKGYGAVGRNRR